MKQGANRSDQNEIVKLHTQGFSVGEISRRMRISAKVVDAFVPKEQEGASELEESDQAELPELDL